MGWLKRLFGQKDHADLILDHLRADIDQLESTNVEIEIPDGIKMGTRDAPYAPVMDEDNNVIGLWVKDPNDARDGMTLVVWFLQAGAKKDSANAVVLGGYRVVENMVDDTRGCFVMIGSSLAPGEGTASETDNENTAIGGADYSIDEKEIAELHILADGYGPPPDHINVSMIESADKELELNNRLVIYFKENMDSVKLSWHGTISEKERISIRKEKSSGKASLFYQEKIDKHTYTILVIF